MVLNSLCRSSTHFLLQLRPILCAIGLALCLFGCQSSGFDDAVRDLKSSADLIDGIPRKTIDTSRLGVNAFANDPRFGTVRAQMGEVSSVLRLKHVRVLFAWSDEVQPSPDAQPNFSFYDEILASIPEGVDVLVVVTGIPSWMYSNFYWSTDNPRATFVDLWLRKLLARYGSHPAIVGWQIWNEPNMDANFHNRLMGFKDPANYIELLALASDACRERSPGKLVLNAATTSVNQNYPGSLDYNRALRDLGARDLIDRWAIHFYGRQFENVLRSDGVADFLNGLGKPTWVTEIGVQGVDEQLAQAEEAQPFLSDEIDGIERFYQYQLTEDSPPDQTFGLRNLNATRGVSDLYIYLRDRE